ncbi:hypothetical protein [Streptomyces sp. URMC 129]
MLISHADVRKEFQLHYIAYRRIKEPRSSASSRVATPSRSGLRPI